MTNPVPENLPEVFTKEFIVEYLLDKSLEPALDDHLQSISKLDEAERTEQIFDFHVADIAMGSGHFLVAAIDRIEQKLAIWLENNPTPGKIESFNFFENLQESAWRIGQYCRN